MTERVDFYILKSETAKLRWRFACRLTEKAYLGDLQVVVFNETPADTEAMDELLWTFNDSSFVPHIMERAGTASAETATPRAAAPVRLTPDLDGIDGADLLVNLSGRLPARLERFARIAEIIDADAERRRLGRERFKAYRELQLPLETHQLDDAADA
jgi:DNA polymerase-3 subunit chi